MAYQMHKDEEKISIRGNEDKFVKKDLDDLWENHNILYLRGSHIAVLIEERHDDSPLVHVMNEEDGHIYWNKDKNPCFDSYLIDSYIKTLNQLKKRIHDCD